MQPYVRRVESALADLKRGKMVILTDSPDRENEGDLIMAAEQITPESMNFIIRHSSGIVCLSLMESQIKQLGLSWMVPPDQNNSQRGTPFTVSIDAKVGTSTGVSATDRVRTIQAAISPHATSDDLVKPGHIFPLQANKDGVLARAGHTEGAVDLARLAGFLPAAVLCEVMNEDGTMARGEQLQQFAERHQLTMLSIEDIIYYRLATENLIADEATARLPLQTVNACKITVIKEKLNGLEHVILEKAPVHAGAETWVRIHSACLTGDLFGSLRCDCNQQLHYSLQKINENGGLLIYLNQEGRGIGLLNKIKAYALQETGLDTIDANKKLGLPVDSREYYMAAAILRKWGIEKIRLLTNNPGKLENLKKYGIDHIAMEPIPVFCNEHNKKYLFAKKNKLNHSINDIILSGVNF